MRSHRLLILALLLAALPAAPASAVVPLPFGHACVPLDGALKCATAIDAERVPSFDGVPLDVDVWLPADALTRQALPTIAMIHGWGGTKNDFQDASALYSAQTYAKAGYAVVLSSARGFGRSCGKADSRTSPGCDRGWIHLADSRYEVRDQQYLLGLLVDAGIADPAALGATGISYGGGTSLQLAYLKDRERLPDGSLRPWTSPGGTALKLAAAWPRWPWSDLADALMPNGRTFTAAGSAPSFTDPIGVDIQSYQNGLYLLGQINFLAPAGADPTADLPNWKALIDKGEPYGAAARTALKQIHDFHGAEGIPLEGAPAPLLIQNGWTDDLFPVWQGLRAFEQIRKAAPDAPVAMQIGDLGHPRGANHPKDGVLFDSQGAAWFDGFLRNSGTLSASAPPLRQITAYGQSCPKTAPSGIGAWTGATLRSLARGQLTLSTRSAATISSSGGDAVLAKQLAPLNLDACKPLPAPAQPAPGTLVLTRRSPGFTLAGSGTIVLRHKKTAPVAQVSARLWDVDPKAKTQRLVDRSITRLPAGTKATLHLNGNGWRFAAGHVVKLELLGRDAPTYRPSNGSFTVKVSAATLTLPTREALER